MTHPSPWTDADRPVRLAIRRRSLRAARDLFADFQLCLDPDESALPLLDQALEEYARSRRLLGNAGIEDAARNIGLLAGEILVSRRGAHWVVDDGEDRIGLAGDDEGPVGEPVRWALERARGEGPALEERVNAWIARRAA